MDGQFELNRFGHRAVVMKDGNEVWGPTAYFATSSPI